MDREPVPSAIVARLLEAAKELEEWAVEHRQATLAEHEKGVLRIFRRVMGPALGAVLERALGLDHPAAQRQRAACPACGVRRRPHQWRNRQPVSPSGLIATSSTLPRRPTRVGPSLPPLAATSHTRTVVSRLAVATRVPSGLHAATRT